MKFTNEFDDLDKRVKEFIKNKVDTGVTFGNPCYTVKGKYLCYCDIIDDDDEIQQVIIPLEEMETHILCGIADEIVEMNKGLGNQN